MEEQFASTFEELIEKIAPHVVSYWKLDDKSGIVHIRFPDVAPVPPITPPPAEAQMFEDIFGWLPDPVPAGGSVQGKSASVHRFSRALAPDGTMAVRHAINRGEIVDTLAYDSPVFRPEPGYKSAALRFKVWFVAHRNRSGKYISLMGGRGQAGGWYQNHYAGEQTGPEGWSFYMNTGASKNDPRAPIGPANRSDLGAICQPLPADAHEGGDPVGGNRRRCYEPPLTFNPAFSVPLGRWVDVEFKAIMNTPSERDGEAHFTFDGKTASKSGVMWHIDPLRSPELYVRWRMMYGGTPSQLPAPNDVTEYYKDFKITVTY